MYFLGLLANDMVFDAAPLPICRAYYCALLSSLTEFPHMLRMLVPVGVLGASLAYRISWSQESTSKAYDIATALLVGLGGPIAFYNTTSLSGDMCAADLTRDNMETMAAMQDSLLPWH